MHLPQHQQMLRNAHLHGGLAAVMQVIKAENKNALHTEATLSQRRFLVAPKGDIPHAGFVRTGEQEQAKAAPAYRASSGTSAASNSKEATDEACALATDAA